MALTNTDVQAFIIQAISGKQSAYKVLLDEFWNYVYGFQLKRTENEFLAEDITIQTFAKAFDKLSSYNPEFHFKTWLISISKNIHIDILRKERISLVTKISKDDDRTINSLVDHTLSAEDELIKEQNLSLLLESVKQLKPHYQEMITLRYFQELSYKEIAETVNEPINNVKVKLLRARKLLAEIIIRTNQLGD